MIDSQTFRSRLVELMQRSRRAMRAYAGMNSSLGSPHPATVIHAGFASSSVNNKPTLEFSELQAEEWRSINADLLKHLGAALDQPNPRMLLPQVLSLLERLGNEESLIDQDITAQRNDLLLAFNSGDYIKTAICSRNLVILKARQQATAAAHSELEQVVGKSRSSNPVQTYVHTNSQGSNSSNKKGIESLNYAESKGLFVDETHADESMIAEPVQTTIELDSIVGSEFLSSSIKPKALKSINFQEEDAITQSKASATGKAKIIPLRRAFR